MGNEYEIAFGVFAAILVVYLFLIGIGIANYIMTSLGLYSIADKRQISNPWLAWLPIGNSWIIGAIADEYDSRNGLKRKWRLLLLILNLIIIVFIIIFFVTFFVSIFSLAMQLEFVEPTVEQVLGVFIPMYIFMLVLIIVSVTAQMCTIICLYKIFESTVPEKSVKYLLLSLLLPLASAVCLMICRKKGYSKPELSKAAVIAQFPEIIEAKDLPSEEE